MKGLKWIFVLPSKIKFQELYKTGAIFFEFLIPRYLQLTAEIDINEK